MFLQLSCEIDKKFYNIENDYINCAHLFILIYRALKRISSVKLKRTSLPANPAVKEDTNGEQEEDRRASTIVPPLIEDLCLNPAQMNASTSSPVQLAKPNNLPVAGQMPNRRNISKNKELEIEKDDNNDSGIIINIDNSEESADFVHSANPVKEDTNGEQEKTRRAFTIVPPLIEALCLNPAQIDASISSPVQLAKPNIRSVVGQMPNRTNISRNKELEKDENNDSGIIINIDDSEESADFVYPRTYTSTLDVVIK